MQRNDQASGGRSWPSAAGAYQEGGPMLVHSSQAAVASRDGCTQATEHKWWSRTPRNPTSPSFLGSVFRTPKRGQDSVPGVRQSDCHVVKYSLRSVARRNSSPNLLSSLLFSAVTVPFREKVLRIANLFECISASERTLPLPLPASPSASGGCLVLKTWGGTHRDHTHKKKEPTGTVVNFVLRRTSSNGLRTVLKTYC